MSDCVIITLTACWSDWILVHFLCIICSDQISAETECVDIFFNSHLDMLIRWFSRSVWSDWSSVKVDCSTVTSALEEESVIWDFIVNSIVNFRVQIKTSDVESDVESVVSDVEDWSYLLKSDNVVVVVCFCEDFSDKDSKSETRMSFQSSY